MKGAIVAAQKRLVFLPQPVELFLSLVEFLRLGFAAGEHRKLSEPIPGADVAGLVGYERDETLAFEVCIALAGRDPGRSSPTSAVVNPPSGRRPAAAGRFQRLPWSARASTARRQTATSPGRRRVHRTSQRRASSNWPHHTARFALPSQTRSSSGSPESSAVRT